MSLSAILTAAQLATDIAGLVSSIPTPPPDLTQKARWQTITVVNQTQYTLVPTASYFDSGRYWTAPTLVEPFEEMTFSICNADTSFFTGATGAMVLQVVLDQPDNIVCNLGVGFGSPWVGSFDTNAVFDASSSSTGANPPPVSSPGDLALNTYNSNSTATVNAQSATFSGTDTNGQPTTIVFNAVAIPAQEVMVTITQQITSGGN